MYLFRWSQTQLPLASDKAFQIFEDSCHVLSNTSCGGFKNRSSISLILLPSSHRAWFPSPVWAGLTDTLLPERIKEQSESEAPSPPLKKATCQVWTVVQKGPQSRNCDSHQKHRKSLAMRLDPSPAHKGMYLAMSSLLLCEKSAQRSHSRPSKMVA